MHKEAFCIEQAAEKFINSIMGIDLCEGLSQGIEKMEGVTSRSEYITEIGKLEVRKILSVRKVYYEKINFYLLFNFTLCINRM